MKISRSKIQKDVKNAYKGGRDWCRNSHGRYFKMMIDTRDGEIWCDVFLDENSWEIYHSDTIRSLQYVPGYVRETEQGYIDDAIRILKGAGWIVTE